MGAGAGLVKGIDSLVREIAVGNIAVGQLDTGLDGSFGIIYIVVGLIFGLDVVENRYRLLGRSRLYHHLLEATFEGTVLLYVDAVFIESSGSDALQLPAGKGRLQHIGGVHLSLGISCAYDSVYLVDEQNDILILRQFGKNRLDTLLEFAAVFGAGDERRHVECDHTLVEEHARDLVIDDAEGQALDYGRLAHARFANQHRIILLAAAENLGQTLDLGLTPDDRVKLAGRGCLGHVVTEFVKHRSIGA